MRKLFVLSLLMLLVSCNHGLLRKPYIANADKYRITKKGFIGNSKMVERSYINGQTMEQGKYAIDNDGNVSTLKVDEWLSYFEDGQLKSKGKFKIGSYIQCCFSGHCKQFYSYKAGTWKYYHFNGQLKAVGEYETVSLHLDTSCEGGDSLPFGLTTPQWKYFNNQGEAIQPDKEMINELERIRVASMSTHHYISPDIKRKNIQWTRIENLLP